MASVVPFFVSVSLWLKRFSGSAWNGYIGVVGKDILVWCESMYVCGRKVVDNQCFKLLMVSNFVHQ